MDIEILNEQRLRYWSDRIHLPGEATEKLVDIMAVIHTDEELLQIFTDFYEKKILQGKWDKEWDEFPIDPKITEKFGEDDTLFYLVAHMAALPHTENEYIQRGIDIEIFDATMDDIRVWLLHYFDAYGKWMFKQFPWIWRHLACELYRLGRMQFALGEFDGGITAIKEKRSHRYILLADPTVPLRQDGYAHNTNAKTATGEPWLPSFKETPLGWLGHIVSPFGYVLHESSFFEKSSWDLVLTKGDTILDMHIPRKDRFTMEDCRDSYCQAINFFARYYPDRLFKASYCHTWFFSPQLQQILPAESNIVRFQREFYLYPFSGSLGFLWFYVFGEGINVDDRIAAPRKTTLQRAVLNWLDVGGEIFDLPGIMFHNPDEWGTQPYMRQWEQDLPGSLIVSKS